MKSTLIKKVPLMFTQKCRSKLSCSEVQVGQPPRKISVSLTNLAHTVVYQQVHLRVCWKPHHLLCKHNKSIVERSGPPSVAKAEKVTLRAYARASFRRTRNNETWQNSQIMWRIQIYSQNSSSSRHRTRQASPWTWSRRIAYLEQTFQPNLSQITVDTKVTE